MALDRDIEIIARQPLLGLMPREALRLIAFAAEKRGLRAGDILFRKGDAADGGYLVLSGQIAFDPGDAGAPAAAMAGPGALIGETALFAETARPATAMARESGSVMILPRALMTRVLSEFPEAAAAVHDAISVRVTALSRQLAPVRARLAAIER